MKIKTIEDFGNFELDREFYGDATINECYDIIMSGNPNAEEMVRMELGF